MTRVSCSALRDGSCPFGELPTRASRAVKELYFTAYFGSSKQSQLPVAMLWLKKQGDSAAYNQRLVQRVWLLHYRLVMTCVYAPVWVD